MQGWDFDPAAKVRPPPIWDSNDQASGGGLNAEDIYGTYALLRLGDFNRPSPEARCSTDEYCGCSRSASRFALWIAESADEGRKTPNFAKNSLFCLHVFFLFVHLLRG
jgi:hypothetical protein